MKISLMPWIFTFIILIVPSSIWVHIGAPYNALYLACFLLVLVLVIGSGRGCHIPKSVAMTILFFGIGVFIGSIYWGGEHKVTIPFVIAAVSIVVSFYPKQFEILKTVELSSKLLLFVLILTWISFFWALAGGGIVAEFRNIDGRMSALFLASFSNYWLPIGEGDFIRPSGIYDEPGTYSFLICAVVFAREACNLDRRTSWYLLFLGLITTSLAHVVFLIFYFLHCKRQSIWPLFFIASTSVSIFVIAQADLVRYLDPDSMLRHLYSFSIGRFVIEDGSFAGDNRSGLIASAISLLGKSNILFGLDPTCVYDSNVCQQRYGNFGENPIWPYLWGGLWGLGGAHYAALFLMLYIFISNKMTWLVFGMFLLYMQRPGFVISPIYSIPIYLAIIYVLNKKCGYTIPKAIGFESTSAIYRRI